HQLARGCVEHLSGNRVELEPDAHVVHAFDMKREKIEENRTVPLGREGDELAATLGLHRRVDGLEARGLPREARPVIDDLRRDLVGEGIDGRHWKDPAPIYHVRSQTKELAV